VLKRWLVMLTSFLKEHSGQIWASVHGVRNKMLLHKELYSVTILVVWFLMSRKPIGRYQRSGETYCLHMRAFWDKALCSFGADWHFIEVCTASEMSVYFNETTWRYIPEGTIFILTTMRTWISYSLHFTGGDADDSTFFWNTGNEFTWHHSAE
jgi:hypothetical protein